MNLGERIRSIRTFLGLTQEELANRCGVSRVSIGNYERGTRIPDSNILKDIALALSTSTDKLLGQENLMESPAITDFAQSDIYFNFAVFKNSDNELEEYLENKGYRLTPNIFELEHTDVAYHSKLEAWKKPENQYYILQYNKEKFCVPPQAIEEFETNIIRAIEFEWYKLKEKYKKYDPPTLE